MHTPHKLIRTHRHTHTHTSSCAQRPAQSSASAPSGTLGYSEIFGAAVTVTVTLVQRLMSAVKPSPPGRTERAREARAREGRVNGSLTGRVCVCVCTCVPVWCVCVGGGGRNNGYYHRREQKRELKCRKSLINKIPHHPLLSKQFEVNI